MNATFQKICISDVQAMVSNFYSTVEPMKQEPA